MNKNLLSGASLFTNDDARPYYDNGAVVIGGGKIIAAGPREELKTAYPDATEEKLAPGLLTPGLVNLHHHLYSSFARGWNPKANPRNFPQILEQVWWRLDEALGPDDIFNSAMIGLCESVLNGVTAVVDHHSSQNTIKDSLELIASAFEEVGLRGSVCFEISDRKGGKAFDIALKESVGALGRWPYGARDSHLTAMVGLHASMTLSDDSLARVSEATKIDAPGYHFHLAEDKADQDDSLSKYNMRAAQRFAKHGLLNEKSLAVHGVHLDKSEIAHLRSSGTNLALCPRSNQNNAVGFAPWWDYDGVSIGFGTDGIGSDIIQEAKSALHLSRHAKQDPDYGFARVGQILLKDNPAIFEKITGRRVGKIAASYPADIVYWRYDAPTSINAANILGHVLYGICGTRADSVWVEGKRILEGGRFIGFDYGKVLAESRALAGALWKRIQNID